MTSRWGGTVKGMGHHRASQIRTIKVAVKQLGLDDWTYRALLMRVTGKTSCAQMSDGERGQVLDALKAQGAVLARRGHCVFHHRPKDTRREPKARNTRMLSKVEALLADAQRPWDYAHAMAKHMFGVDRLEFLRSRQLHKLVAALQIDANRRAKRECV